MGNIFNLQQQNTRNSRLKSSQTNRIIAVPVNNVTPASVLRQVESRPLQGLPSNISKTIKQVNVKNTLPTITTSKGLIDVINNFDWTTTPSRAGAGQDFKVPSVRIQEFEMDRLSVVRSIQYQLQAFSSAIGDGQDAVNKLIQGVNNLTSNASPANSESAPDTAFGANFANTVISNIAGIANAASGVTDTFVKYAKNASNAFQGFVNEISTVGGSTDRSTSRWLSMLDGLYSLNATQFEYIFPYFENRAMDANPRFANFDAVLKGKFSKEVASGIMGMAQGLSDAAELSQPGVYIEQPQLMDISSAGSSDITVTFPLLNTLSFDGAVKNYQLLWLLAFQNKPYRESKTVVSPAKVYRVYIPGIKYMHFAHISNLSVDFLGVRRTVRIPMPTVAGTPNQVNVVMPDAYKVSVTFKSLTTDMGNMMIEQLKRGAQF